MNDQRQNEGGNEKSRRRCSSRGRKVQRPTAVSGLTPFESGALLREYAPGADPTISMRKEEYEVRWRLNDFWQETEERIIDKLRSAANEGEEWARAVLWPLKVNGKYVHGASEYSPYKSLSDETALKNFYSWLEREERRRLGLKE